MNELTLDGSFDCKNNIFNYSVALKFKHVTKNSFLSLKNSTFNSNLTIEGCFYEIPDLRNTYIKNHMSLGELEIKPKYSNVSYSMKNYPIKIKTPFKIANSDEDHDKIRRLKELLEINRAHQRALDFHVLEIKARRWHITKLISQIPEYLFGAFSDYGRSLLKPLSYFVSLKIICSVFYSHLSNTDCCTIGESLAKSFLYSLSSSLGFISQAKDVREINQSLLFNPIPDTVQALSIFEGIFSAILIFLFILSLRNRFRI
ncbi:hypothetical protein TUMSATVNIG1_53150 [Vibrio nigripulchritudo]|nr:hypothetical protein [Vibrio nigripulchritudo]BDU34706.1 hypothetical protein TUMSATVNIG1_53150 [Vibrio nigripulchritudo]